MAEGFARKYGADVMRPGSAGLSPADIVQPLTKKVMAEKNVDIDDQFPKDLAASGVNNYDLLINMSGVKLPGRIPIEVREWKIDDPIGRSEDVYIRVRDQIEDLVMRLVLELRRQARIESRQTFAPDPAARMGRRRR
jgi:arsenate reductase